MGEMKNEGIYDAKTLGTPKMLCLVSTHFAMLEQQSLYNIQLYCTTF